jgi:hypothetical protein
MRAAAPPDDNVLAFGARFGAGQRRTADSSREADAMRG